MPQFDDLFYIDLRKPSIVRCLKNKLTTESAGLEVGFSVYYGDDPVTLSGTVTGYIVTALNETIEVTGSAYSNIASIQLPAEVLDANGRIVITIKISSDDKDMTIGSLTAHVANE